VLGFTPTLGQSGVATTFFPYFLHSQMDWIGLGQIIPDVYAIYK
jgi:hypothetical protein